MTPYPASLTREMQRTDELLAAIADWAMSHAAERSRNRRWAMRLLAAERARRDERRAEVQAAVAQELPTPTRTQFRRAA